MTETFIRWNLSLAVSDPARIKRYDFSEPETRPGGPRTDAARSAVPPGGQPGGDRGVRGCRTRPVHS